ncbi:MAG: hypothetical protein O3B41_09240 [Bacteroidetes bacterium]|nr:hypothetical protein [Bacteroidota bacterium]
MKAYPIFLLPKGEVMMTVKIEDNEIIILKKTLFPSNKRYSISETGLAACLDVEKKLIIYGFLKDDGEMEDIAILPFPSMISPKSICIVKNHFILGGENNHYFSNNINSNELVATYSILQNKYSSVEMPFKKYDKCIDDLLLDNYKVIAVDNIVYPKYLLEYDFTNPNFPHLIVSHSLPENGTYESIKKGTLNDSYIALLSSSYGMDGGGEYVNIFRRGNYQNYIRLSQWYGMSNQDNEKKYYWRDILLLPNHNVLLIPSNKDGIGIYYIDESLINESGAEDSDSIQYFNRWGKKVIKILLPPQSNKNVIVVLEEGEEDNISYSFALESIAELLAQYDETDIDDDSDYYDDDDSWGGDDDTRIRRYCRACEESPCMCSDREKTSTTYDF